MTFDYALRLAEDNIKRTGLRLDPVQTVRTARMIQKGVKPRVLVTIHGLEKNQHQY